MTLGDWFCREVAYISALESFLLSSFLCVSKFDSKMPLAWHGLGALPGNYMCRLHRNTENAKLASQRRLIRLAHSESWARDLRSISLLSSKCSLFAFTALEAEAFSGKKSLGLAQLLQSHWQYKMAAITQPIGRECKSVTPNCHRHRPPPLHPRRLHHLHSSRSHRGSSRGVS